MPASHEEPPGPHRARGAPKPQAQTQRGDPGGQEAASGLQQDGGIAIQAQRCPQEGNIGQAGAAGTEYAEGGSGEKCLSESNFRTNFVHLVMTRCRQMHCL